MVLRAALSRTRCALHGYRFRALRQRTVHCGSGSRTHRTPPRCASLLYARVLRVLSFAAARYLPLCLYGLVACRRAAYPGLGCTGLAHTSRTHALSHALDKHNTRDSPFATRFAACRLPLCLAPLSALAAPAAVCAPYTTVRTPRCHAARTLLRTLEHKQDWVARFYFAALLHRTLRTSACALRCVPFYLARVRLVRVLVREPRASRSFARLRYCTAPALLPRALRGCARRLATLRALALALSFCLAPRTAAAFSLYCAPYRARWTYLTPLALFWLRYSPASLRFSRHTAPLRTASWRLFSRIPGRKRERSRLRHIRSSGTSRVQFTPLCAPPFLSLTRCLRGSRIRSSCYATPRTQLLPLTTYNVPIYRSPTLLPHLPRHTPSLAAT